MGVATERVSCDAAQGSGSGVSVLGKHKVYQNEPLMKEILIHVPRCNFIIFI